MCAQLTAPGLSRRTSSATVRQCRFRISLLRFDLCRLVDRCEDIPGWMDKNGNTCKTYATQGWCCEPNMPHCNAAYANIAGQDSDDGCCATCSSACVDDDALALDVYGHDCRWVADSNNCASLLELGIANICGCACLAEAAQTHRAYSSTTYGSAFCC